MTNYASLVLDIQRWTEDDSSELSAAIPDIISLAEDRILADLPFLLIFRAEETDNMVSSTDTITVPKTINPTTFTPNLRSIRSLFITVNGDQVPLEQRGDNFLDDYAPDSSVTGQPKYYTVIAEAHKVRVVPTPDSNYPYTVRYRGLQERLTSSNTTTKLSLDYPGLIFKAALLEAAIFLEKAEDTMMVVATDYKDRKDAIGGDNQNGYIEEGNIGA